MKQFEYLVKESYPEEFELNELGAQGWELIHITESRYIYKREKPHYEVRCGRPYEVKPNREDEVRVEEVPEGVRMEDVEKERLIKALQQTKGDKRKAAELVGLSERTFFRKCKEYGLKK